ncbi:MAG: YqaJ viral recombinase family protein [Cypionkella sp.]|nr:YqaJ viral recombinase family protein [Cypionkella sp.]
MIAEQGSAEWLAERAGRVTASALSNVMMATTTAGYQNYLAQIVCERLTGEPTETFKSAAMEHGTETEPQARAFYEMESGLTVQECGFCRHPVLEWSGASPDGLVAHDGLVEIKCPQPAKHIKNLIGSAIDKAYILQMQWQMECTGREWCDFVSFNPSFPDHLKISVRRVQHDAAMVLEITEAVRSFLGDVDAMLAKLNAKKEI